MGRASRRLASLIEELNFSTNFRIWPTFSKPQSHQFHIQYSSFLSKHMWFSAAVGFNLSPKFMDLFQGNVGLPAGSHWRGKSDASSGPSRGGQNHSIACVCWKYLREQSDLTGCFLFIFWLETATGFHWYVMSWEQKQEIRNNWRSRRRNGKRTTTWEEQTYSSFRCPSEVTVIVDPTGEIAGSGDACHPAVKRSWKEAAYSEKDRKGKII